MITVEVDNRLVMQNLNRLEQMTKKPLETLMRQSGRRVCVNLSRTIAPFGFGMNAKDQGEKAVMGDYMRSTKTVEPGYLEVVLNRAGKKKNIDITLNSAETKEPYPVKWQEVAKGAPSIRRAHNPQRNRYGRVKKRAEPVRMVTTKDDLDRGMQKAIRRVGLAKYAYAMAARSLGGTRQIPAWVKKSRGVPNVGNAIVRKARSGYIVEIDNRLSYASLILSAKGERDSMKRESDYLVKEVEMKMQRRWKR